MTKIVQGERVRNIRDIWKDEVKFSKWLKDNISTLGDVLGLNLSRAEREVSCGRFSADVTARTSSGELVVVENKFGSSDHDHLGKLLTYWAALDARIAVLIVEDALSEHKDALLRLNAVAEDCDFYLLKLEAIKVQDFGGAVSPLLTKIVEPLNHTKIPKLREQLVKFFEDSGRSEEIERGQGNSERWALWYHVSGNQRLPWYGMYMNGNSVRIDFNFEGNSSEELNKILDAIMERKADIEEQCEVEQVYRTRAGEKSKCIVRVYAERGGFNEDVEKFAHIAEGAVAMLAKLDEITRPFIQDRDLWHL